MQYMYIHVFFYAIVVPIHTTAIYCGSIVLKKYTRVGTGIAFLVYTTAKQTFNPAMQDSKFGTKDWRKYLSTTSYFMCICDNDISYTC